MSKGTPGAPARETSSRWRRSPLRLALLYITTLIGAPVVERRYTGVVRRWMVALLVVISGLGITAGAAAADTSTSNPITLSYDFSDNGAAPSVSGGVFNVAVDVLPEQTRGVVRMVAVAPADSGASTMVCKFQDVVNSRVRCAFTFTVSGTWTLHAQYAPDRFSPVAAAATTNIRVGN